MATRFGSQCSHRQSSGFPFSGGNWAQKLPPVIGIHLYGAALKTDTNFRECTRSAMVKPHPAVQQKKNCYDNRDESKSAISET
ncbi:hypothetical protein TNCV_1213401 [Trichonephila clavipes]|nr:hypothetical protein TNCV_1213401 [Trichonephila clavipes]